jgi:3-oxoadipate enol-lactonase
MPQISSNGTNINYEIVGQGDPLLLIMGFGMPGAAWAPMLPYLSGFQGIYFDNRGTGLSDKPEGAYSIAEMADDASNLIRRLGLERVRVYGISMGGMIAQELALRHPEQVGMMVLGCTTPGGTEGVRGSDEVLQSLVMGSKLMALDPDAGIELVLPLLYPPEFIAAHPELRHFMRLGMTLAPPTPPETADKLAAGLMEFDTCDRLHEIECPVMIVHGAKDIIVPPSNATLFKERIRDAELFMIPEAGHNYPAADPVGIHHRITSWLRN